MTDISRTSVTLAWKSKPSPSAEPASYLIEAFRLETNILNLRKHQPSFEGTSFESFSFFCHCSYTLGSRWVTLAEHIKNQSFVVKNLKPATVYLFMVRAVNAFGLSDPSPISDSVRTQGQCCCSTSY